MVRLAGIEPTTPWFVAKYSIQLSYSRQASNYSAIISPDRSDSSQPRIIRFEISHEIFFLWPVTKQTKTIC